MTLTWCSGWSRRLRGAAAQHTRPGRPGEGLANRAQRVFARPVRPDELLLDAARGITRWAVAHSCYRTRPRRRPAPVRPHAARSARQARQTLDAKYGWREGQPTTRATRPSTVGAQHGRLRPLRRRVRRAPLLALPHRAGLPRPHGPRDPRFVKCRWAEFVASLRDEQKEALADWLRDPAAHELGPLEFLLRHERDPLTEAAARAVRRRLVYPKWSTTNTRPTRPALGLPPDAEPRLDARSDSAAKTAASGTTAAGGRATRPNAGARSTSGWPTTSCSPAWPTTTRPPAALHDDQPYEGLHQIVGRREIDPSLPPIDFRAFSENEGAGATAWQPPPDPASGLAATADLTSSRYQGDVLRFLADTATEPTVAGP